MQNPKLLEVLDTLGADLDMGTECMAQDRGVPQRKLLSDLVAQTLESSPEILSSHYRKWSLLDAVVVVAIILVALLGFRAVVILAESDPRAEKTAVKMRLSPGPVPAAARESELANRTLLTVPIEPASYSLLGDLPTRLSAAVVPKSEPESGTRRPVTYFDNLLVLEAEAAEDRVAVLVALPPGEVARLMETLPGAVVHLLRSPALTEANAESQEIP